MIKTPNLLKHTEKYLIVVLWVLLASIPLFLISSENETSWSEIMEPLRTFAMLFVVFLINRLVLVPYVLLKKKNLTYSLLVIILIGAFSLVLYVFHTRNNENDFRPINRLNSQLQHLQPPGSPPLNSLPPMPPGKGRPIGLPPFANFTIMAFLLVGFDTGLNTFFRLNEAEKERSRLEQENITNQLDMLRHQVSPHFLMNTLNNIHTLIDISGDKAKDAVIKLSKLMRYLLYDTKGNTTTLKNEIAFVESYIELMKLRVSEKVKISLDLPNDIPNTFIPPLLFTSFIENAFKHGISYQHPSFIAINMLIIEGKLKVVVKNSRHAKKQHEEASGIGIENAKKRLNLLYNKNYELDIIENETTFTILLMVPLKNNEA